MGSLGYGCTRGSVLASGRAPLLRCVRGLRSGSWGGSRPVWDKPHWAESPTTRWSLVVRVAWSQPWWALWPARRSTKRLEEHAGIQTTLNIYTHVVDASHRGAIQALE